MFLHAAPPPPGLYDALLQSLYPSLTDGTLEVAAASGSGEVVLVVMGGAHVALHRCVAEWAFRPGPPVTVDVGPPLPAGYAMYTGLAVPGAPPRPTKSLSQRQPPGWSEPPRSLSPSTAPMAPPIDLTDGAGAGSRGASPRPRADAASVMVDVPLGPWTRDADPDALLRAVVHALYHAGQLGRGPITVLCAALVVIAESVNPSVAKLLLPRAVASLDEGVTGDMPRVWANRMMDPKCPFPVDPGFLLVRGPVVLPCFTLIPPLTPPLPRLVS